MSTYEDTDLEANTNSVPASSDSSEVLLCKIFCVCACEDLEVLVNRFLIKANSDYCYKPELMVSLGRNWPCEREKIALFYRRIPKICPIAK